MIRLAGTTAEISQEIEHALVVMRRCGARGAEFRRRRGTPIRDWTFAQRERVKQAHDAPGKHVGAPASPLFKCSLQPAMASSAIGPGCPAVERARNGLRHVLERAPEPCRYFNMGLLWIFTFWRCRDVAEGAIRNVVQSLALMVRRTEEAGV